MQKGSNLLTLNNAAASLSNTKSISMMKTAAAAAGSNNMSFKQRADAQSCSIISQLSSSGVQHSPISNVRRKKNKHQIPHPG